MNDINVGDVIKWKNGNDAIGVVTQITNNLIYYLESDGHTASIPKMLIEKYDGHNSVEYLNIKRIKEDITDAFKLLSKLNKK